ncbi:acyl-CoA dehydrogenase [Methylophaga sp. OBS4]|uniref:acyl-CoA dehydrogenase n=1 Tax=Methylophaga sp. OBS4 TaxID=2991935 RepID=UPI00225BA433|nr:acyl-CoA dehydrogenase [Methylophaga sp. OBS4]MCX4186468.1 acyl-CoA dehydrogenase [Methylophaga sp. OBS4]
MKRLWTVPLLFIITLLLLLTGHYLSTLIVFAAAVAIIWISSWRKFFIIEPIVSVFRRAMPPLSATEREALESGTVWWDGELFSGKPDWTKLLAANKQELTGEEQAFLAGPVEQLCEQLNDWQINHQDHDLPPQVWDFIKQQQFFGLIIPKQYGGLGFSPLAHSQVIMKVASRSVTASVTVMVPNSLGPAELLLHYGTQKQKDYYLPRLARGEEVPCFALTGPEAGSDASNIPDKGIVCKREFEGKEITGILLNWEKRYITLGPVATLLGLAFHLYDPDHLLGDSFDGRDDIGITLALIPTDTPGIRIGQRHWPMGTAFQNGPNWGKDVFIPLDWIIGGVDYAGQGWHMLMESLAAGRSISLPALSAGAAKLACRITGAYAQIRKQFHQPIGHFEGIADVLGRMAGQTYMIDAVRRTTAQAVSAGERPAVLSAIAKYQLTEAMRRIVNDAMDVHGGKSICLGSHNVLANIYQTIPISITVEGANILTRNLIIFGQGAIRAHPYILQEMAALEAETGKQAVTQFNAIFSRHLLHTIRNIGRSVLLGVSKGRFSRAPPSPLRPLYQQINHLSAAMAVTTDFSLALLGGSLKRRESLSSRMGDVLSQLYLASCSLQNYEHNNEADDIDLARWAVEHAVFQAQQALINLLANLPNRFLGWLLKRLVFPLGPRYRPPSDKLTHRLAQQILQPGPVRDRLTAGIYLPADKDQVVQQLELTLALCVEAEPIEQMLRKATLSAESALQKGVISDDEFLLVVSARSARSQAIAVDHFSAQLEEAVL